ncbi:YncE family protein [Sphingobacterium sp. LRF_L2]|uniref:YncE family protein n=1 Tax=Sphingobacterium sp. LRF_L2 TaxID=3369421 RepID=UPI003F5EB165
MKNILKIALTCTLVIGTIQVNKAQTVRKSSKIGDGVYELVYNSKNNSVYVTTTRGNSEKPTIYQLDANTLQVKDSIMLETSAFGLGINTATQTLYGTSTRGGSVLAIDLKLKKVLADVKNGAEKGHTREAVIDEKNNKIYASDVQGGVWAIDGKTNSFIGMLNDIKGATGLTIDPAKDRLYTISKGKVVFYDLKKNAVIDSFETGAEKAINLALDAKRNHLFVSHQGEGTVTVLDADKGTILKTIPAGTGALGITYSPANDRVFVANRGANTVTVINAADYTVVNTVEVGSLPNTVVVDGKGNAYVSNKAQGAGRPKQGEKPKPSNDPNGDIISLISL